MFNQPVILFCENPFAKNTVDNDFLEEYSAAVNAGFTPLLINFEDLSDPERCSIALRKIKPSADLTLLIYRGWMLTPGQYQYLYDHLLLKKYQLINSPAAYQNCHYLPDSLRFIREYTPETVYEVYDGDQSIEKLIAKSKIFGNRPVILKDYVKSEKHDWDTACYVSNTADEDRLRKTINTFIDLRGRYLNKGLVLREYIELKPMVHHSKSGMPLTEEYRLFFAANKLLGIYNYWEEGKYSSTMPDTALFEKIAWNIESNFFSMDIARKTDGSFTIIELGDGQVSGLPGKCEKTDFYLRLKKSTAQLF